MYHKFEKLLAERHISAYAVSVKTGIPQSSLSDWKTGRSKPKVDKLMKLAKYFDVPLEYFLEE